MPSIVFMSSESVQSQTPEGRKNNINLFLQGVFSPLPRNWRSFHGETRRGNREAKSVLSFQVTQAWEPLLSSHLSFPQLLLLSTSQHYSASVFLSESLETENKLKSCFSKNTQSLDTPDWEPAPRKSGESVLEPRYEEDFSRSLMRGIVLCWEMKYRLVATVKPNILENIYREVFRP